MKKNYNGYNGCIVKLSGDKTIKVRVLFIYAHKLYKKTIKRYKHFLVHNVFPNVCIGDEVLIAECRPLSKMKHFYVKKILNKHGTEKNIS